MEKMLNNQNSQTRVNQNHQKFDLSYDKLNPKASPRIPSLQQLSFKLTQTAIESENNIGCPISRNPLLLSSNCNLSNYLNVSLNISPSKSLKSSPYKNQFMYQGYGTSPGKDKNSLTYTISLQQIEQDERIGYNNNFYGNQNQIDEKYQLNQGLGFYRNWNEGKGQSYQSSQDIDAFQLNLHPCEFNQDESQRDEVQLNQNLQNRDMCILKDLNSQSQSDSNDECDDKILRFDGSQRINTVELKDSIGNHVNCRINTLDLKKNDIKFASISSNSQCQIRKRSSLSFNRGGSQSKSRERSSKSPLKISFSKLRKKFTDREMSAVIQKKKNIMADLIVNRNKISSLSRGLEVPINLLQRKQIKLQNDFLNGNIQSGILAQQSKKTLNNEIQKVKPKQNLLVNQNIEVKKQICKRFAAESLNSPKGIRNKVQKAKMKCFKKQNRKVYEEKHNQHLQDLMRRKSMASSLQVSQIMILGKQITLQSRDTQKQAQNQSENRNKRSQTERIDGQIKRFGRIKRIQTGFSKPTRYEVNGNIKDQLQKVSTQCVYENESLKSDGRKIFKQKRINQNQFFQDNCMRTKNVSQIVKRKESTGKQNRSVSKASVYIDPSKLREAKSIFDQNILVTLKKNQTRHIVKLAELLKTKKK